jgi:hypothetical protein
VRRLLHVELGRLGVAFAVVIGVLAVLGAVEVRYEAAPAFDLDDELKLPALAAALILLVAVAAAWLAASADPAGRWPWLVLAGVFALMAADEALSVHETLEDLTTVDWQTLYLPVMALAGIAWLAALGRVRRQPAAVLLLVAGAAAWGAAGLLEAAQWTGPRDAEVAVDGYGILMGIEEVLEMCGSAAFALAPLIAARAWVAGRSTAPVVTVPEQRVGAGA